MNTALAQQIANEGGVEAWMIAQQHKSLLRFLTCGSVDDGKSTLIGRLLHDTRQIYEDQLSSLHNDSKRHGTQGEKLDLALLVDGLQAEREQGITIDVAYRYFSTEKRKFIIADTPGHEQYTRNMATGASTCELAILLIDARKGVLDQTRRHSFISTLLGIKHLVVAINKMDLVDYSEETFTRIREDYLTFAEQLPGNLDIRFVPLSALEGDNVASQSESMPWYSGPTLLEVLETVEIQRVVDAQPMRFPVQYVNRPNLDFRGYAGTLASGRVEVGQRVKVLPSGVESNVARIVTFDGDREEAFAGEAITLTRIREDYLTFAEQLPGNLDIRFVPLSALEGDNVASQSESMPWYSGPTLLEVLETVEIQRVVDAQPMRFPVQYVNRPNLDFRGYAGTLASGRVEVGQRVKVLPSGVESNVARIVTFDGDREEAFAGEAITLVLTDEIDISRGDLLLAADEALPAVQSASVDVVWMAEQPLSPGQSYDIKIAGKKTRARVDGIRYQVDINNLTQREVENLPLNGIGLVDLTFDEPLVLDRYQQNPVTGGLIFIDRLSNVTVGAGMVHEPVSQATAAPSEFSAFELELNALVRRHFPHWGARDLLGDK